MVELRHNLPAPKFLIGWHLNNPGGTWNNLPWQPEKQDLRQQLNQEQDGLCVYCESKLDKDSGHIEHIQSRHSNPSRTFDYTNMGHSCDARKHCGHFKANNDIPVTPGTGANSYFLLSEITGRIGPDGTLSQADQNKAKTTIEILGLNNDPGLIKQRQDHARVVRYLGGAAEIDDYLKTAPFRWSLKRL